MSVSCDGDITLYVPQVLEFVEENISNIMKSTNWNLFCEKQPLLLKRVLSRVTDGSSSLLKRKRENLVEAAKDA